jgi:hypothetical protein
MVVRLSALRTGRYFTPQKHYLIYLFIFLYSDDIRTSQKTHMDHYCLLREYVYFFTVVDYRLCNSNYTLTSGVQS